MCPFTGIKCSILILAWLHQSTFLRRLLMNFPTQVPLTYSNPQGNLVASGLYRSYLTQDIANDFPQWMRLRDNNNSTGQQFIASEAILLEWLESELEYNIRSKFLQTSPLDDIDVLS